jgi:hypothetical protein
MGKQDRLPLCEHVREIEGEYGVRETVFDDNIDIIIITLGEVESGSDFDNSDYGDGELYGIVE